MYYDAGHLKISPDHFHIAEAVLFLHVRWERGLKNHEYVCLTEPLSDGSAWALCRISFFPTPTQQKRQHSLMEVSVKGIYLEEMWARSCQKAEWTPGKLQWIGRKTTHSHNVILEVIMGPWIAYIYKYICNPGNRSSPLYFDFSQTSDQKHIIMLDLQKKNPGIWLALT